MKQKGLIMATFVTVTIIIAVIFTILLITSYSNDDAQEPDPIVDENDEGNTPAKPGNVIEIEGQEDKNFNIAAITPEDTVKLFTENGESIDINLSRNKWKDLKWSPSGDFLSVLTQENSSKFDLSIFEPKTNNWEVITNYSTQNTGISKYIWFDETEILFNQGEDSNNWLHIYDHRTSTQVLKVERIDGKLETLSNLSNRLIYKMNKGNDLEMFSKNGESLWELENINNEEGELLVIQKIIFGTDPTKLIFSSTEGDLYKIESGKEKAFKINLDMLDKDFIPVCSINTNNILGYKYDQELSQLLIARVNTFDETEDIVQTIPLTIDQEVVMEKTECINSSNLLFNITEAGLSNWYLGNATTFAQYSFLTDMKEVDVFK